MNGIGNFSIKQKNKNWLKFLIGGVALLFFLVVLNFFVSPIKNVLYAISSPIQKTFWSAGESSYGILSKLTGKAIDANLQPIYRCYDPRTGNHILSRYANCDPAYPTYWTSEGLIGYLFKTEQKETYRLDRCWSEARKEHFTSKDCTAEGGTLNDILGYAYSSQKTNTHAVYRCYWKEKNEYFDSLNSNCEGYIVNSTLGWFLTSNVIPDAVCGDKTCNGNENCSTCAVDCGNCECTPNCKGKQCGDNGCGGSCGTCQTGQTCIYNICNSSLTCTDDCSLGQTQCNGNYKQICDNYEADSCLEWGGDVLCVNGCESGECNAYNPTVNFLSSDFRQEQGKLYLDISIEVIFNGGEGEVYTDISSTNNFEQYDFQLLDEKLINGVNTKDNIFQGTVLLPSGNARYTINGYACNKEDICSNFDTSVVFEQIGLTEKCKPLYSDYPNLVTSDRVNIVVVGADYSSKADFIARAKKIVDLYGKSSGIFALEPFKSSKNKFNFWYVDQLGSTNNVDGCVDSYHQEQEDTTLKNFPIKVNAGNYCFDEMEELANLCHVPIKGFQKIFVSERLFHSHAKRGTSYNTYPVVMEDFLKRLLFQTSELYYGGLVLTRISSHEFGHSFGNLNDEYVMDGTGLAMNQERINFYNNHFSNCYIASSENECLLNSPWKNMKGNGCGSNGVIDCREGDSNWNLEVGCFKGCFYNENVFCEDCKNQNQYLYRPNFNSLMNYDLYNIFSQRTLSYGPWNEKKIQEEINRFSGNAISTANQYEKTTLQNNNYLLRGFAKKKVTATCNSSDALVGCLCNSNKLVGVGRLLTSVSERECSCTYIAPIVGCGILVRCPWVKAEATCLKNSPPLYETTVHDEGIVY